MWMIQILADESDTAPMPRDSLFTFLAAHGIPPEVMRSGLDQLRRSKSLRLCKLAAEREWEIWEGLETPSTAACIARERLRLAHQTPV
jgi:hypothetical protein